MEIEHTHSMNFFGEKKFEYCLSNNNANISPKNKRKLGENNFLSEINKKKIIINSGVNKKIQRSLDMKNISNIPQFKNKKLLDSFNNINIYDFKQKIDEYNFEKEKNIDKISKNDNSIIPMNLEKIRMNNFTIRSN